MPETAKTATTPAKPTPPPPAIEITDEARDKVPALVPYKTGQLATFGASVLTALVQLADWEDDIRRQQAQTGNVGQFIGFELVRAVMEAKEKDAKINLYAIWEGNTAVEKLYIRLLTQFGVLKMELNEDGEPVQKWTSKEIEKLYSYPASLKKENEAEYNRRFNNRKRLNQRLSDAIKTAITLVENNNKAEDLKLEEAPDGKVRAVIENAPSAIAGTESKRAVLGMKTLQTGASHTPTLTSLIKIAKDKHDAAEQKTGERSDVGQNRPDTGTVAKMGMGDEAFGEIVNTLKQAINAQEGNFTAIQVQHLIGLRDQLIGLDLKLVGGKVPNQETNPDDDANDPAFDLGDDDEDEDEDSEGVNIGTEDATPEPEPEPAPKRGKARR